MTAENPLFNLSPLPRFDLIRPEHVAPAIDALLAKARAALEEVTAPGFAASWQALSATLDVATERLSLAWGVVSHLNAWAATSACMPNTRLSTPMRSMPSSGRR